VLRTILQQFSRNIVLKRRLPVEFGNNALYVSPDSALRYWKPGLVTADPELMDVARRYVHPGMTVWDIGANVGLFSFCAAAKGAKVYSVEADPFLVSLLRRSQRANHLDVTPIPLAISDKLDLVEFHIAQRGRSANHLGMGMSDAGGTRWTEIVPCATLDWLAERLPPPDFIKIDVEAMENAVLRGGMALLQARHPRIFCEVSEAPESRSETTTILRNLDYRLFNVKNNQWVDNAVFSTLAVFGDL
jgi:FkbM family methyltransferase